MESKIIDDKKPKLLTIEKITYAGKFNYYEYIKKEFIELIKRK
ncbi:hypothetical protein [Paenibacillus naphthalenovorans]|nr:hypothetical protein [Paenibacillus naphthalenovorans]